jgi:beta-1,4-mannosyl-glycoprotein beta-1,4-N-acetylglucosaminyltransferase
MATITEAISMYQELDLLEAHLEESSKWADRIIIIESERNFAGLEKPLYFYENRERFTRFNVEHLVTPKEEIQVIPPTWPKEEQAHWFKVRQQNRNHNRQFHWDELRRGTDYVYLNDVDEFISGNHFGYLEDCLKDNHNHYISIRTQKFNYWMNAIGAHQSQYRITRSDKEKFYVVNRRQCPKASTEIIGWHFTNCMSSFKELQEKMLGICVAMGKSTDEVPSEEVIQQRLSRLIEPLCENSLIATDQPGLLSTEKLDWCPTFVQANPKIYPWLKNSRIPFKKWKLPPPRPKGA